MALEGSLRDFGLADILQLIFFQRKTGVLTLESRLDKIRILFIDGHIVGADSKRRTEAIRLGKILIKKGLIREGDLESLLEDQQKSNLRLGSFLVRNGYARREDIAEVLEGQIKETVIQLFGWKEGSYEFVPQAIPVDKELPISIDTQHLLMEALRIVDEWTLIEGKITLDTVFVRESDETSGLSDTEREILLLVDGDNDVSTVIDMSGRDDFEVSKTLVSLAERGIIRAREFAPVATGMSAVEARKIPLVLRVLPAAAIVLGLLLSVAVVLYQSRDSIKTFRTAKAVDEMKVLLAAHKFAHGSYPASIELVGNAVDAWGIPYRYQRTADSFSLFSVGPDGREGTDDDIY